MPLAFYLLHFHEFPGNIAFSPFIVPVAGCLMVLGIVLGGVWAGVRNRQIQSEERLAAIARGIPIPPTAEELAIMHGKPSIDATRRRANIRLGGIILVGAAAGLAIFFIALATILQVRPVLCGAAAALIPLGIGIAMLYDVRVQTREIEESTNTSLTPRP